MSKLKDGLKSLFPTTDPSQASRNSSGALETERPEPKQRREGDYLPVIAVLVGVALLGLAYLRPQSAVVLPPPPNEANSESDW